MLRFAYSTINWGATCDLPQALAEIREAGWDAVELFGHSLDHLGSLESLTAALDGLAVATLFGSVALPTGVEQRKTHQELIARAAELGAAAYGIVGGQRLRYRPPTDAEYAELSAFLEDLAVYGAARGVAVSYHPHTGCTVETADEAAQLLRGMRIRWRSSSASGTGSATSTSRTGRAANSWNSARGRSGSISRRSSAR
jgi:sugar phosphate isomerase/epimerase